MIDLNLEDIKLRTSKRLSRYTSYSNNYKWVEVLDTTEDKKYKNTPLFDYNNKPGIVMLGGVHEVSSYVCFGQFTYNYRRQKRGSRIIFTSIMNRKVVDESTNNHCWMTPEELTYWLETAREESKLNYYFNIETTKDNSKYQVTFDFRNLSRVQMKFVLFWTRYAFEYPASLCALDAMLLKRDYFPEESLINLLTLTADCQIMNTITINSDQCITTRGKFICLEEFRRRLRSYGSVQNIFGNLPGGYGYIYKESIKNFFIICENTYKPADWLNETERLDIYSRVYKVLKENEIPLDKEKVKKEEAKAKELEERDVPATPVAETITKEAIKAEEAAV